MLEASCLHIASVNVAYFSLVWNCTVKTSLVNQVMMGKVLWGGEVSGSGGLVSLSEQDNEHHCHLYGLRTV